MIFTYSEMCVLTALRELHRGRDGELVQTHVIRDRSWDLYHVKYDAVQRALKSLLASGHIERPRRGFYRPIEEAR